jgi:pimeloyl-ACP methyl ester carboxylesterase
MPIRLESYDWRREEAHFNASLPQFRTTLSVASQPPLRIHFVHKRSRNPNAIPLLFCHSWPSSFIEIQRIIDALVDPISLGEQAFHVVVPSIPGFGFSDASADAEFGVWGTAEVYAELMRRLGYERFVACGSDWYVCWYPDSNKIADRAVRGFDICRALAVKCPRRCRAVHTTNPVFDQPSLTRTPLAWLKWNMAKLTQTRLAALSFGYTSLDVSISQPTVQSLRPLGPTLHRLYSLRPQTLAFSLCDSPMGLLAGLLDTIHSRGLERPAVASRSRSRSVCEQGMRGTGAGHERVGSDETVMPEKCEQSEVWSAPDILNWTMM